MAGATLTLDNPVFAQFLFYAGVVLIKTCLMSLLTARYRNKNKAIKSPALHLFLRPHQRVSLFPLWHALITYIEEDEVLDIKWNLKKDNEEEDDDDDDEEAKNDEEGTAANETQMLAFRTEEDCQAIKRRTGADVKPSRNDPDVERVRGCHQNDLENVIPFVLLGLLYILTDPNPWYAKIHFRIFTVARLFHSVAYLNPLPQPSRALGWLLGYIVTLSMGISVVMAGVL